MDRKFIDALPFPTRIKNAFVRNEIDSWEKIKSLSRMQLMNMDGMGGGSLDVLTDRCVRMGIHCDFMIKPPQFRKNKPKARSSEADNVLREATKLAKSIIALDGAISPVEEAQLKERLLSARLKYAAECEGIIAEFANKVIGREGNQNGNA